MSGSPPDDELVEEYLAESREHLATIEADLLAMEKGGADIDEELVNRVFRAAHSIKGGAGFFDLTTIRELAHKIETALELVRSRQMTPTPEVVSLLLISFDKLSELVRKHRQSNQADISDFTAALTRLAADHLPAHQKQSITRRVAVGTPGESTCIRVSEFDLDRARSAAKTIYLIQYDLIHDVQRRGKAPLELLKLLIDCGTILETAFDLDSAGTLDDEPSNALFFEVLYATVLEPDLVGQVVEVPPERVRVIAKDGSVRRLSDMDVKPIPAGEARESAPPGMAAEAACQPVPKTASAPAVPAETTIRLNVGLLDSLMTLAGELVLSRNQLNEALSRNNERAIRSCAQRMSVVTSELQEAVTGTRMQPVGNVFAKFPRLIRGLAHDLGKDVQLNLEGGEVEIDKSILEGLSDPLTHMVRNAVDHGIEPPVERVAAGKRAAGTVKLRALQEAGQVVIEISDDGRGLAADRIASSAAAKGLILPAQLQGMTEREKMALIFLPGVSTAAKVSDVSGRGVGMDVVKTNLDKLGGKIEIDSSPRQGTQFRIKLPLTLAIIPSLLVSEGGNRFAIPQVNVGELIRIPVADIARRICRLGDAEVLLLRNRVVPLVRLSDALGFSEPGAPSQAVNVVLVNAGAVEYGLLVAQLHDTAEIVVKPLGRHLKALHDYAGATILGDGRVALILDVAGLAARMKLSPDAATAASQDVGEVPLAAETKSLLLFHNAAAEICAIPIERVVRIERAFHEQIEYVGGRRTMQYRGASLPLVTLHDTAQVGELSEAQPWVVIVFEHLGMPLGLLAAEPLDLTETEAAVDRVTLKQSGISGSAILKGRTTLILDLDELAESRTPVERRENAPFSTPRRAGGKRSTILLAEDSDFFRNQIQRLVEAVGYDVIAAEDGQAAWELLNEHAAEVAVVATDVEMPRLDGLGLTRQIRADHRFAQLPIIALSCLAGEDEIARGLAAGVDEYQIKLNRDELLESIQKAARRGGNGKEREV